MRFFTFAALSILCALVSLSAQDFGFGDETGTDTSFDGINGGGRAVVVNIHGEVKASVLSFFDDFADGADHTRLGEVFSGELNFFAETSRAKGDISLKLQTTTQPVAVDEAYLTVYFGELDIEAGLRKLTWGKADSLGSLDVINPLDYSDLSGLGDAMSLKIARPLVHASLRLGQFSKWEGVFIPSFEPLRFADTGRWAPAQFTALSSMTVDNPDTTTIDYFQAGLRYTTTLGSMADIGVQYYYGRLTSPAVSNRVIIT
jgi:hypothetical protein